MRRRPPRSTPLYSSAASDVYKRQTYDYAIALRAVNTVDFMTAEAAEIPYEVLSKVMSRIINEVRGVNRVMYDLTSKPPGTIEFE